MKESNLYQNENFYNNKTIQEKPERILDSIISKGTNAQTPEEREKFRLELRDKIKRGFITRKYLSNFGWDENKVLIIGEIVDFLIPPIQLLVEKDKEIVKPIIKNIEEIILPTKNSRGPERGGGSGISEKKIIPKFELLAHFLKENKITEDSYLCYKGKNDDEMMRRESYIMFVIPDLNKMVLMCDEEDNATYIIHNAPTKEEFEKLKHGEEIVENERLPSFYYKMTKNDLIILSKELGIVSIVNWDEKKWLEKVEDELTKKVSSLKIDDIKKFLEIAESIKLAPPGWMTKRGLARQLKAGERVIGKIANKYLKTNKDWVKLFKNDSGNIYKYYSPELIEKITEEFGKYELAPSGWMTKKVLTKQLKASEGTIKKIANKYLKENKDWAKLFKNDSGNIYEYYSPELIEKITEELTKYKTAPIGWVVNTELAKQLKSDKKTIKKIANKYLKENKDWAKLFKNKRGRVCQHYSLELIEKIKYDLAKSRSEKTSNISNNH